MDAAEHLRRMQWAAASWVADHELLEEQYWEGGQGARWVVGRPKTFVHRAEVIAGIGGSLIVHGDFDLCRFGHYGDHRSAWRRLLWMADCTDVGYYVAQKASIGMGGQRHGDEYYDADVAAHDLKDEIAQQTADGADPELIDVLTDALEHTENEQGLREFLHEHDKWDLWEYRFGEVVPHHVVTNHCILQRTAILLRAKYGDVGPMPQAEDKREPFPFPPIPCAYCGSLRNDMFVNVLGCSVRCKNCFLIGPLGRFPRDAYKAWRVVSDLRRLRDREANLLREARRDT